MTSWGREADQIVGTFSPRQIQWIRTHLGEFSRVLWQASDRVVMESPILSRGCVAPVERPHRQAMMILAMRAGHPETQHFTPDILACRLGRMRADVDTVLATLPPAGDTVVLPGHDHVWAWIWVLYEYGMFLAMRLGLEWGAHHLSKGVGSSRAEQAFRRTMSWLVRVVNTLLDVADLPIP